MEVYNVEWSIAHSSETKRTLERYPRIAEVNRWENLTASQVRQRLSYFLEGGGTVAVNELDNLVLDGLEGDTIIWKYKYVSALKSNPATIIESIAFHGWHTAFIRVLASSRALKLYLGR